jgi:DNA polymerase-1
MKPATPEAYQLMHEGALALADVEANGIRIDVEYLKETKTKVSNRITGLQEQLKQDDVWKTWNGIYKNKTDLGSRKQMARVLYDETEIICPKRTKPSKMFPEGQPSTDAETLGKIKLPFVKNFLEVEKLKKLRSTYLNGILREVTDGFLHPFYNLHIARSFRSSSSEPNFQNMPIRDEQVGKLLRRAFIPRKDRVLVEVDYSSLEVMVASCYHKDPTMLKYLEEGYDMHLDMAADCYKLDKQQVTKDTRYCAKNMFVFPQFYGDYFVTCAKSLWEAIGKLKLKTSGEIGLREHLKKSGIKNYQQFEKHIEKVEDNFWNKRFPVYTAWKDWWWNRYEKRGWFRSKTGFLYQGVHRRNEVINYPVQGAAFHCLLWSLIEVNKTLKKKRMGSLLCGQIHDSLILDVVKKELDDVLILLKEVMVTKLRKAWNWLIVPLEIEVEGSEKNWFEKKEI